MEETKPYRTDDDWTLPDDEREYETAPQDEVPFHIPRH